MADLKEAPEYPNTGSSSDQDIDAPSAAGSHAGAAGSRTGWRAALRRVAALGRVEVRGIAPIPVTERTVRQTVNVFTIWWCMNANILPITFGMLGPVYGLGLRDCALVILFFTLLTTLLPAYLSILGPKLGMRQMIQARWSASRCY
jgi:hypothetical protein